MGEHMGFWDALFGIFKGKPNLNNYQSIHKWLSTKITPGNEKSVRTQLLNLLKRTRAKNKREALRRYIDSGVWKHVFVRK